MINNWTNITANTLRSYLDQEQLDFLSQNNAEIVQTLIEDTCTNIQAWIPLTLKPKKLAGNTIPRACQKQACHLIIEALHTRLPDLELSATQRQNAQHARQELQALEQHWQNNQQWIRFESVRFREHDANTQALQGL